MSEREKRRSLVLRRVATGALTLEQATRVLSLSYRHMKRVWKRFRDEGTVGLAHKGKGRPSNRAFQDGFREEVLRRYRQVPAGTGPTQFAGMLGGQGIFVDHETLRRWLLDSGAWKLRRCKPAPRQAEPFVRGFGELLTLVSLSDSWLGAGLPSSFLLFLYDEATSRMLCSLSQDDSCEAAMRLLGAWIERHGLPAGLRCQRRFVTEENNHPTLEQQLRGGEQRTALARACERLGIDMTVLGAPQAKTWLNDRCDVLDALKGELGRHAAVNADRATKLLFGAAGDALNRRFAGRSDDRQDFHVPIVDGTDLRRFLCVDRVCHVEANGTVTVGHRQFRLAEALRQSRCLPARVVVSEWLDGSFHVLDEGRELPLFERDAAHATRRLAI
jgi:transposase